MARFRATGATVHGAVKYKAGTVFADTVGNALAGDVVWPGGGLDTSKMSPNLVPLDGAATTMMGNSRFAGVTPWPIDGAHSIGG
jgi:hypothetical protein